MDMTPVVLEPVDHEPPGDHPDEVTDAEAEAGRRVYLAVDDLDDDSTGEEALTP